MIQQGFDRVREAFPALQDLANWQIVVVLLLPFLVLGALQHAFDQWQDWRAWRKRTNSDRR